MIYGKRREEIKVRKEEQSKAKIGAEIYWNVLKCTGYRPESIIGSYLYICVTTSCAMLTAGIVRFQPNLRVAWTLSSITAIVTSTGAALTPVTLSEALHKVKVTRRPRVSLQ